MNLATTWKSIGGAILAGLITLGAVAANAHGIGDVTFLQWVLVATSVLGTGIGVYAIPNAVTSAQKDQVLAAHAQLDASAQNADLQAASQRVNGTPAL